MPGSRTPCHIRARQHRTLITAFAAALIGLVGLTALSGHAYAFGLNPTPYDPENYIPSTLAPRSTSAYFVLDASLPREYQRALDDRKFIGITGLFLGGFNSSTQNESKDISVNDTSLMNEPNHVCSIYSRDVCYDLKPFYRPHLFQIGMIGLFALDGSTMLQWGFNTGYDALKLTVSPSIMIGLAKRFYFSDERRDSHIIIEASQWFGGFVKHRPCIDDFDRKYYCGDLSAWSSFTYDPHPDSLFYKITYETLF